jgi:hypothetical protein
MCVGWTIGEELFYSNNDERGILRMETCTSLDDSCLL